MGWHCAAEDATLGEGQVIGAVVSDVKVALYRVHGVVYATSNICSHAEALLSEGFLDGDCIECPLHGAQFSVVTGEALTAPAHDPVAVYLVKIEDGQIFVDLPD